MSHNYPCDWRSGFVMDPNKKQRVGYLTSFKGLALGDTHLAQDLEVFTPFPSDLTPSATVTKGASADIVKATGIIESFSFEGGVGDPLCFGVYISAENGNIIKAKMKSALTTTKITELGWWIVNFDEENKKWYEEAYPKAPVHVTGQLNAPGSKDIRLHISDEPTKIANNIDVNVYMMYFEIVPAANMTFALNFATSAMTPFVRNWGLKVGLNSGTAMSAP
jgi:hypothetical protein